MAVHIDQPARLKHSSRRPLWLSILACFSILLGIITAISQFYYVLFALHLVTIGPNSNLLGQIWYSYILNGDNSYQKVDPGVLAWSALYSYRSRSLDEAILGDSRWAYHGRDDLLCDYWLLPGRHLCWSLASRMMSPIGPRTCPI